MDVSRLADEFGADIGILLPILDAGELLGLVKSEKGEVSLTEFGLKFQKTSKNKIRIIREQLSRIEPFKTALELSSKKRFISAGEVAEELTRRDIRWHHEPELNEALVKAMLIHWAIYAGLLTYDGKTGKFQKA
ncbi:MAG: AAA-associated domain-containing protein [Candidatus Bathyarchaeia archaeon]